MLSPQQTLASKNTEEIANGVVQNFDKDQNRELGQLEYVYASLNLFESMDKNKNEVLEVSEVQGYVPEDERELADTDHDGVISVPEALVCFMEMFKRKDLNHDGRLNFEEIQESIRVKKRKNALPER